MARIKYFNPNTEKWEYADSNFAVGGNDSGGNASAPADWNAAEGEPGHVLNRTHYTERVITDIVPTKVIQLRDGLYTEAGLWEFVVGESYVVTFQGEQYECVAFESTFMGMQTVSVGNEALYGGSNNTGEPFAAARIPDMEASGVIAPVEICTIGIVGVKDVVHPLDDKYINNEVKLTLYTGSCSKTWKEIVAALDAKKTLVAENRAWTTGVGTNVQSLRLTYCAYGADSGVLVFQGFDGDVTGRLEKTTAIAQVGYVIRAKNGEITSVEPFNSSFDPAEGLRNPYALTINGTAYDGSKAVNMSIPVATRASVKDFGAVGDGVTDDTVAIQAALDAGGDVYFPAGRYKVTAQLTATKPCVISMDRQYPSNAYDDYPKSSDDNYMGARIETYSPTNGIVIGDSVNLDGFYIRAMAGFGSGATAGTYGGKGIILQYDGSLGYRSYPSTVRLRHIRVDIAYGTSAEIYAVIPESLFHFAPKASYHYIIEDVQLGQHNGMKYCDYAFRADLAKNASWSHNVFVRNMNIEAHCDYGVHITGNSGNGGNACGWMFDGLVIQAYGYIQNDASNVQNRPGHRALLKMSGVDDIAFYSCYLWDTGGTATYPAYYSDGGEIVVNGSAKADTIKNSTTVISCVGCSSHFNVCETYIHKKLNSPENLNIKDLAMSVTADEATGGNRLTLDDGTYRQSAVIPSAVISEEQITNSVNQYLDDATTPKKNIGRNKFDASRNGDKTLTAYDDFNLEGDVYGAAGGGAFYDKSATNMWSTHFIPAEYGDVIRMSQNGVLVQAYRFCCFNANMEWLGTYHVWAGSSGAPETIDYRKPHVAIKGTAFIRICFDRTTMISYPTDSGFPNLCITVNDTDISYEPYEEKYEAKMGGLLPSVTEADNGKVLKVVNGVWVAVAE